MPKTFHRTPLVALVAVLVLSLAAPAGADSLTTARQRREAARQKRAQIARELNALRASDSQLEAAVKALDEQVRAQSASAEAARQSVAAAEAAVQSAEEKLGRTEREIAKLRKAVVDRAVNAYVRPQRDSLSEVWTSRDLNDASRRSSLLEQVANHDRSVLDRLAAAKEDLDAERAEADRLRETARRRRELVEARLAELRTAKAEKDKLASALDARIRAWEAEAAAMAQTEAQLAALIREREAAAARASRSSGSSGGNSRVSSSGLIWPTSGPVTSEYGYRWGRLHAGIDIAPPYGTPIKAAKAGEVIATSCGSGYGLCILISHGGGFTTLYAHQSRIAVSAGQSVSQGQVIGYVGNSGNSTGPHLHFETRVNGSPQNPRRYLP